MFFFLYIFNIKVKLKISPPKNKIKLNEDRRHLCTTCLYDQISLSEHRVEEWGQSSNTKRGGSVDQMEAVERSRWKV